MKLKLLTTFFLCSLFTLGKTNSHPKNNTIIGVEDEAKNDKHATIFSPPPAPANDVPCGAIGLPVTTTCSYTSGTTNDATLQTNGANGGTPSCSSLGEDVWYSFEAPAGGAVQITTQAGSITDGAMALYSGSCNSPTEIACDDDSGTGLMPEITAGGLTPGATYFIRFWDYGGGFGTFDICLTLPPLPPANDNCATATNLTMEPYGSCTPTNGTVDGGTGSGTATGCSDTPTDDVWYSFVANNDTAYVNTNVDFTADVEILSSCTASIGCSYFYTEQGTTLLTGLTVGNTYYIRIFSEDPTYNVDGNFTVCVTGPPPAPNNDDCADAIVVTMSLDGDCNLVNGNVTGATSLGSTVCGGTNDDDVWYSFVATNDSAYVSRNANFDSYLEVRTNCGSNSAGSLLCTDAEESQLLTSLTVGTTYYYRIYSYSSTSPTDGSFTTCVASPAPPPPNISCPGMMPICSDTPITFMAQSGGEDAETLEPGNDYDCLSTTPNPTWFYLQLSAGGTLSIDITASSDIDYAIWGPYPSLTNAQANCNAYPLPADCSYSSSAIEQANITGTIVGETYVLLVTNYADVPQNISLNSSPSNTATTDCAIVTLPIELIDFSLKQAGMSVQINWETGSELNNDYFTVEKSINGSSWSQIAKVKGAGTTNSANEYNAFDDKPYTGISYYRIKQTDVNGDSKYTKVEKVEFKGTESILVYPQPAKDKLTLVWDGFDGDITWMDFSGQIVNVSTQKSENGSFVADVSQLQRGIYFIRLSDGKSVITKKITIQ